MDNKSIKLPDGYSWDSSAVTHNRKLLSDILSPVVLYENTNGSNGDISLTDDVNNYSFIDIEFRSDSHNYSCQRIYKPFNKNVALITQSINYEGKYKGVFLRNTNVMISGKNISVYQHGQLFGGGSDVNTVNFCYITQVVGYK